MLVLTRKLGEEIKIGDNIRLIVVAIRGNQVRLGFRAPPEVPIQREELTPKTAQFRTSPGRSDDLETEP
jgi:carbon storage regulator